MKFFSANIEDLRTLYTTDLQKALDMERQICKALPDMMEKSSDAQLTNALRTHLRETEGHASKVENLLQQVNGNADTITCKALAGLVTEAQDSIKDAGDANIRDVTIIACAQQVEHHEMAVYGTLRTWANILGRHNDAVVLETILNEEKHANSLLNEIAETANLQAV